MESNTNRMNDVVERLRKGGTNIEDAWLRRMGPGHSGHINFRGILSFGVERYIDALIQGRGATIRQEASQAGQSYFGETAPANRVPIRKERTVQRETKTTKSLFYKVFLSLTVSICCKRTITP